MINILKLTRFIVKIKVLLVFGLALCSCGYLYGQQSLAYAQYQNNLTPFNSAYSLLGGDHSVSFLGRKQWVGINGAPSSIIFNGHAKLDNIASTVGFTVINDKVAVENLTEINAFFAKAVKLNEDNLLAASLNVGFRSYLANYAKLDPYDPKFKDNLRETSPTAGLGIMLYNPDKYYLGISLPRFSLRSLGEASAENVNFKNTWYFAGAYLFGLSEDIKFKPTILLSYTRTIPLLTDVSALVYFKDQFGIGMGYNSNKQLSGTISYSLKNVVLTYSYQKGIGNLTSGSINNTTHEIGLVYRFGFSDARPFKVL